MQPGGIHLQPANVQAPAATGFKGLGTWRYRTETVAPPASGQVRFNNADPTLATEMYLHETNDGGTDVANFLDLLTDGAIIYLQEQSDADNHFIIEISSNTDSGTYRTFGIQAITLEGVEPSQNTQMLVVVAGGSGATIVPTPVGGQITVFASPTTIEGDANFTYGDNAEQMMIQVVLNSINNVGLLLIDSNSVLNPDGWQWCPGQTGLHDGTLILTHKPADTINNRDLTMIPGGRPAFAFGLAVAPGTTYADENAGALAYFQPRDITGREETKISFVGFVGGTGHEGVFSIEGFNYGNAGLQFNRVAHFVVDPDYRIHIDLLGALLMTGTGDLESGEEGICRNLVDGLQIQGQGSSRDVTIYDDTHQITLSSQTGTSAWRFHKRFQVGTYVEFHMNNATDDFEITGAGACDNILWTGYDGFFSIDSDLVVEGNGIFGPGTGNVTLDIDSGSADLLSGELRFLAAGVEQAHIQWFEFAAGGDSLLINSVTGKMQLSTNNTLAMEIATDQSIRYTGTQEWDKGADIASASALVLGSDGNYFDVTGTTTINSISAKPIGTIIVLQFDSNITVQDSAVALILENDVTYGAEPGDTLGLICYDGTNWREIFRTDPSRVRSSSNIADQAMVRGNGGAKRITGTGNLIGDDDEMIMAGTVILASFTDAQLNAIGNAVNTNDGKAAGAMVFNSDQGHAVTAQGATAGSVWNDGVGTLTNTPV